MVSDDDEKLLLNESIIYLKDQIDTTKRFKVNAEIRVKKLDKKLKSKNETINELRNENKRKSALLEERDSHISLMKKKLIAKDKEKKLL